MVAAAFLFVFPIKSKAFEPRKINSGDTVFGLLFKNGFSREQANRALSQRILPAGFSLIPGQSYFRSNAKDGTVTLSFFEQDFNRGKDIAYEFWRKNFDAGSTVAPVNFETKVKTITGRIYGSLFESIENFVKDKRLPFRFMDAYIYDFNLRKEIQRGDTFAIQYEQKFIDNNFIRNGEILTTELKLNNKVHRRQFVPFDTAGKKVGGAFVSPDWNQNDRPFYSPVSYPSISSPFSMRRRHPVTHRLIPHYGVDYEIGALAEVYSAGSGAILRMGKTRGAGNFVVIRHRNGLETYYDHMSKHSEVLQLGQEVAAGQLLGFVGCTGLCTKPHLHFAVKRLGRWLDPIKLVRSYPYNKKDEIEKLVAQLVR